jgi:hypothetical protein
VLADSVKILALGTRMAAFVMLLVPDFGNCGHIVIMATSSQMDGANRCESSPATNDERYRVARVYQYHPSSRFSWFYPSYYKVGVLMAHNIVYYP